MEERFATADLMSVQDGAAKQSTNDVLFLVRAGVHVFMDRKRAGANVIGDPPQASAVVVGRVVLDRTDFGGRLDDRSQNINVEVRRLTLQHRGRALESHAGVDVLARQRPQVVRRVADAIELGEHEVPDLDRLAGIVMKKNLAAGTTNTVRSLAGCAGRPEIVVFTHPHDAAGSASPRRPARSWPPRRRPDRPWR